MNDFEPQNAALTGDLCGPIHNMVEAGIEVRRVNKTMADWNLLDCIY